MAISRPPISGSEYRRHELDHLSRIGLRCKVTDEVLQERIQDIHSARKSCEHRFYIALCLLYLFAGLQALEAEEPGPFETIKGNVKRPKSAPSSRSMKAQSAKKTAKSQGAVSSSAHAPMLMMIIMTAGARKFSNACMCQDVSRFAKLEAKPRKLHFVTIHATCLFIQSASKPEVYVQRIQKFVNYSPNAKHVQPFTSPQQPVRGKQDQWHLSALIVKMTFVQG